MSAGQIFFETYLRYVWRTLGNLGYFTPLVLEELIQHISDEIKLITIYLHLLTGIS